MRVLVTCVTKMKDSPTTNEFSFRALLKTVDEICGRHGICKMNYLTPPLKARTSLFHR